ncbi:DNA polymerase III subunit beta [Paenibacillus glycanilyticus]|uniref:DNA polymerase III subunit beta n=1 Tax=Paenibacillus glycanilyticus TaxID=126569 RepID=UPI00203B4844|nr:DNA polymerase III subunit beta [Paenibacillus glycanilyticus]MCM3629763.1 DNA polymerase III subunit beta [Paenibacillus glycanilyticus]
MLVEITKDTLIKAVQHVIKAVAASNHPLPLLRGIHIQAHKDGLFLTASNTSMTVQSMIPSDGISIKIESTGSVVIPSRYFYDVIRKLHSESIKLEMLENSILTVMSGHFRISLCGMDPADFPTIPDRERHSSGIKLRISNAMFKSTIKQTAIVASTSEARPVLNGVSLACLNNSLNLTATDGVRLASRTIHIENEANHRFNAIIPAKNLYEISTMLSDGDEPTEIAVRDNRIQFSTHGLKVESALIDGIFPPVNNLIPQAYQCEISVDKRGLLTAVECACVLANACIIKMSAAADKLQIISKTAEIGEVENEVPLIEMKGKEFIFSLNGKYLIDILRNMDTASVQIRYSGNNSPIVVLPSNSSMNTLYLITPVRTHH